MTTKQTASSSKPATIVVLGLDSDGKPHAARFTTANLAVVTRAAAMMKFHAVSIDGTAQLKAAGELPEGKIFATGRGLVPFVRRALYDQFATLIGSKSERVAQLAATEAPKPASVAAPVKERPTHEPWNKVVVGTTVLARDKEEDGWYEAVVIAASDDKSTLTLKWRDYLGEPRFTAKRLEVGLILP